MVVRVSSVSADDAQAQACQLDDAGGLDVLPGHRLARWRGRVRFADRKGKLAASWPGA